MLILSEDIPNLEMFSTQFGFTGKYETKNYFPLLEKIKEGEQWRFRLTANPTISKSHKDGRGKVLAHVTIEHQKNWLLKRAEGCGFHLEEDAFTVVQSRWYRFYKKEIEKISPVQMLSVTFEGILTVAEKEKFRQTLCNGIGREKAYGMGLLTIVR